MSSRKTVIAALSLLAAAVLLSLMSMERPGTSSATTTTTETMETTTSSPETAETLRRRVLRSHAGLFLEKTLRPEFQDIVLLTAANSAYMNFLRNWECHAERLGLDWVVFALDKEAFQLLNPSRTLLATGSTSGSLDYRTQAFNLMSLNTLASVFEVMKEGFDVVFTDSDNVFLTNPFATGISFGELIKSQRYDYIYQLNWPGPRPYSPASEVHEGNTGFYFASLRNKAAMNSLWEAVLKECQQHRDLDGQPNFWNALRKLRKSRKPCFRMCRSHGGQASQCNDTEETLDYCEMDPFLHRTGWGQRDSKGPVSYHANFKVGQTAKISALTGMGLWQPNCTKVV